ncbi:MAG TPA: hypothetical protein VGA88_03235 [Burkholderiales bacterium]
MASGGKHLVAAILLLSMFITGCGGSRAVYAPPTHLWIGKCAIFTEPMAYLTDLPRDFDNQEVVRIGRYLTTVSDAWYLKQSPKAKDSMVLPVSPGTAFEVMAVFRVVQLGYSRAFSMDYDMVVLKDSNGLVSTTVLSDLRECGSGQIDGKRIAGNTNVSKSSLERHVSRNYELAAAEANSRT